MPGTHVSNFSCHKTLLLNTTGVAEKCTAFKERGSLRVTHCALFCNFNFPTNVSPKTCRGHSKSRILF
ncbi:hypothetical protein Plhal703r1_c02g0011641 [Plasmopara halstedii]